VQDGFVVTQCGDHRPSISRDMIVSRALVEKNEIFPAFQTLFK